MAVEPTEEQKLATALKEMISRLTPEVWEEIRSAVMAEAKRRKGIVARHVPEHRVDAEIQMLMQKADMTPQEIADALEQRVSPRTIYRWATGESGPQQKHDVIALEQLVFEKCGKKSLKEPLDE